MHLYTVGHKNGATFISMITLAIMANVDRLTDFNIFFSFGFVDKLRNTVK